VSGWAGGTGRAGGMTGKFRDAGAQTEKSNGRNKREGLEIAKARGTPGAKDNMGSGHACEKRTRRTLLFILRRRPDTSTDSEGSFA
jgi:hypothetical protein